MKKETSVRLQKLLDQHQKKKERDKKAAKAYRERLKALKSKEAEEERREVAKKILVGRIMYFLKVRKFVLGRHQPKPEVSPGRFPKIVSKGPPPHRETQHVPRDKFKAGDAKAAAFLKSGGGR